eukprot:gene2329-biopygen18521
MREQCGDSAGGSWEQCGACAGAVRGVCGDSAGAARWQCGNDAKMCPTAPSGTRRAGAGGQQRVGWQRTRGTLQSWEIIVSVARRRGCAIHETSFPVSASRPPMRE